MPPIRAPPQRSQSSSAPRPRPASVPGRRHQTSRAPPSRRSPCASAAAPRSSCLRHAGPRKPRPGLLQHHLPALALQHRLHRVPQRPSVFRVSPHAHALCRGNVRRSSIKHTLPRARQIIRRGTTRRSCTGNQSVKVRRHLLQCSSPLGNQLLAKRCPLFRRRRTTRVHPQCSFDRLLRLPRIQQSEPAPRRCTTFQMPAA